MDANALACVTTLFQQFFFPIGGRVLHDEAKETAVNESDEESGSESAVSHANFKVRVGVGCVWGKKTAPAPEPRCRRFMVGWCGGRTVFQVYLVEEVSSFVKEPHLVLLHG